MKSKKIIASLALTSMLFTTVGSFAADRDIWSVSPEQVYATKMEFAKEKAKRLEVAKTPSNYYFEAHGHLFTMKAANEAFAKNPEGFLPDLKVADAVKPINMDLHVVSVSAINSTEAELVFNKEVKEAKQANFKAMDKDGAIVVIAGAKVDAKDKMKVVLTFAEKFKDKMEYTVESEGVVDVDDKAMAKDSDKFTYEAAEVKSVEFTSTTLGLNKDLIDYVKVTDALGRDVTKEVTVEFESSDHTVVNPVTKKTVALGNAELVAKVKVGADWVKSPKTVVKVSTATAKTFAGYYLSAAPVANTALFEALDAEDKVDYIHIGETLEMGVYFKDQFGESMNKAVNTDLEIETQTPNIAVIDKVSLEVTGVNEGDAYFKVKHKVAKTENLLKVTVKAVSKPAVMEVAEKQVALSINAPMNQKEVKVVYKNQFGDKINPVAGSLTAKSSDDTVVTVSAAADSKSVTLKALKKGMATITLTYKQGAVTLKETIEVTAKEPGDMAGYKAVAKDIKLDAKIGADVPNTTTVTVYEVDKDGVYIREVALSGDKKLVAVDADGREDDSIVRILGTNTVQAVAEGTGYVKVVLDTITLDEKLVFEVINTGQTATLVGLKETEYIISDQNISPTDKIDNNTIKTQLVSMLQFKDQKNNPMATPVGATVEFKVVKDSEDIVFSAEDHTAEITKLKAKSATANLVITKVIVGTKEFTPENELRVTLKVTDNKKLELQDNATSAAIKPFYNAAVTPKVAGGTDFDGTEVGKVLLEKKGVGGAYAEETYSWGAGGFTGAALPASEGEYRLTVYDFSGNATVAEYIIDTTVPTVDGAPVIQEKVSGHWGQTVGDTITITFSEKLDASVLGLAGYGVESGELAVSTDILVAGEVGKFATDMAGTNAADVKATISLDATGKVLTIKVTIAGGDVDSPSGAFTKGAKIKDLAGN